MPQGSRSYFRLKRKAAHKNKTKKMAKKAGKASKHLNTIVKSVVNRTLARKVETKLVADKIISFANFFTLDMSGNNVTQLNYRVVPLNSIYNSIAQGVTQQDRIGNKICVKHNRISYSLMNNPNTKGSFYIDGANVLTYNSGPYYVLALCLRRRDGSMQPQDVAGFDTFPAIYQFGGSSLAPTTTMNDLLLYLNKDIYQVLYRKVHKIWPSVDNNLIGGVNPPNAMGPTSFTAPDAKTAVIRRFYLDKQTKNTLHYNDATAQVEETPNLNCFMVFIPVSCSAAVLYTQQGTIPDGLYQWNPITVTVTQEVTFTDM